MLQLYADNIFNTSSTACSSGHTGRHYSNLGYFAYSCEMSIIFQDSQACLHVFFDAKHNNKGPCLHTGASLVAKNILILDQHSQSNILGKICSQTAKCTCFKCTSGLETNVMLLVHIFFLYSSGVRIFTPHFI